MSVEQNITVNQNISVNQNTKVLDESNKPKDSFTTLSPEEEEIFKLHDINENDIIVDADEEFSNEESGMSDDGSYFDQEEFEASDGENQALSDQNDEPKEIVDVNDDIDNVDKVHEEKTEPKKKRGLPKAMLANQMKYLETLERQQRMINNSKKKNPTAKPTIKPTTNDPEKSVNNQNMDGMRRVMVAGKWKYLPVKPVELTSVPTTNPKQALYHEYKIEPSKILELKTLHPSLLEKLVEETPAKPLSSSMAKKMEIHKAAMASHAAVSNKNKSQTSGKKIPKKYAIQIENDIKKQTVKNVKNFTDLRRVKAMQDITPDTDVDANRASITELRKLRIEQRKKELADLKKKAESNKKETAIEEILKNDKMSKFAKTVAIKNLSVNSRNRNKNMSS